MLNRRSVGFLCALVTLCHPFTSPIESQPLDPRLVADPARGEWTLFVIPDTQHYSQDRDNAPIAYMHAAFDWLVETRDQLNIRFVQGLGDITERGSVTREWERASAAWNKLYGRIPFIVNQGNHDSIFSINKHFPLERFADEAWWGGSYEGIHNSYQLFHFYGEDFLIINVQSHDPWGTDNPGARQWANDIIAAHPDRLVLLGTHDTIETSTIRNDILIKHDNIVLSNAGHSCARERRFLTTGPGDGRAYNFVVDYQCDSQEVMLLRYYVFKPLEDRVDYYTYSPITHSFEEDSSSQGFFELELSDAIGTAVAETSWGELKTGTP